MLTIKPIRGTLGRSVSAKIKNRKDDQEMIIEFSVSGISLTHTQLTDLVACSEKERKFEEVAFVSRDAISELRHMKKCELKGEVQEAKVIIDKVGVRGNRQKMAGATLKKIELRFDAAERCEMKCTIWSPLEEHTLYELGKLANHDVFIGIESQTHGEEEPSDNAEMEI